MRWLARLGWILGTLFVVFVFAGLTLPREYQVQRSATCEATPAQVHRLVGELEAWPRWGVDPTRVTLVDEDPALGVAYELRDEGGALVRRGAFRYEPGEEGLTITWIEAGDLGSSPLARVRSFAREWREGPRLEEGLARLAALAESLPNPEPAGAEGAGGQPAGS